MGTVVLSSIGLAETQTGRIQEREVLAECWNLPAGIQLGNARAQRLGGNLLSRRRHTVREETQAVTVGVLAMAKARNSAARGLRMLRKSWAGYQRIRSSPLATLR